MIFSSSLLAKWLYNILKVMSQIFSRLRNLMKSAFSQSPYVRNYIRLSNARSGILIGIVIAVLEIWMIVRTLYMIFTGSTEYSFTWFIQHTISYFILLGTALFVLVHSFFFLKRKTANIIAGTCIKFSFMLISIGFGLYISYLSSDPSGKVFAFFSMLLCSVCLFTWQPFVGGIILTASYGSYLFLQSLLSPVTYSVQFNSFTSWIVLLIVIFNNHHQKRIEAQNSEELEKANADLQKKSITSDLTKIPNMYYFRNRAKEILSDEKTDISNLRFLFINIENFTNYNEKYGFEQGNVFLTKFAQVIAREFDGDLFAYFSDDHFVALCKADGLEQRINSLIDFIAQEEAVRLSLKAGIYAPKNNDIEPSNACDYARYACHTLKRKFGRHIAEYDDKLERDFHQRQYIINNIDKAIKNGYIKPFYQPVVWAKNGKLCGAEVLARWADPEYGLLSPGAFVPILEEYHLIHKLDMCIMESACRDLHEASEKGLPMVPLSINFSRLDFELANPVGELDRCINQFGIPKSIIHVEITESALTDKNEKLTTAMNDFRNEGYALWLDDFGSGYSGLNVLKDFNFDMMKIDMGFLRQFSENKKTQPILKSIISLADKIGMQTLTEGVETAEMRDFLKEIGCQRLQGYFFGKPMPKEEFFQKITDGVYDSSEL